ncbi:MAG: M48 family metalloprotease [Chloroflexota bacterium]|nr:M48 family metalloprotease [Chloroflexota bacterium]
MSEHEARPRMDPERLRRARSYRKFSLVLDLAGTTLGIAVMVGLYLAGTSVALRDTVAGATASHAVVIYVVVAAFTLVEWSVGLPTSYLSWRRGRREGLVVQSWGGAFVDQLKRIVITLALVDVPVTAWYLILLRPEWALWTIAGAFAVSALGTLLGPALASLFFRFEPLADATVAERVRAVAERAGARVSGVYRWGMGAKTTAANAAVIGVGPTKRIALGDTLLEHFPIDEVESVVAHEVGHDVTGDPLRYVLAFGAAGAAALIVIRLIVDRLAAPVGGTADPASYPLVAATLSVLVVVGRPAVMAFTRWRESAADAFGARHTSRDAMARALVRLADQNLADPEPPRWEEIWSYSHPAIANRVRELGLRWQDVA